MPNSFFEEESDSDDDLIQMEKNTDLDSSIEIIYIVTSNPCEVSVDSAACLRDVHDDDLIQMEDISDLDRSIEVIETVTSSRLGEDDAEKSSSRTIEHVTF